MSWFNPLAHRLLMFGAYRFPLWLRQFDRAVNTRRMLQQYRAVLDANPPLDGIHAGKKAFVIGNGPSIGKQDLTLARGHVVFVMNEFHKHQDYARIRPTYHYVFDDGLFEEIPYAVLFRSQLMASQIDGTMFVVPATLHPIARHRSSQFPAGTTAGVLNYNRMRELTPDQLAQLNFGLTLPWFFNVAQHCILHGILMGCREIVLLGLDHNYHLLNSEDQYFFAESHIDRTPAYDYDLLGKTNGSYYWWLTQIWEDHILLKQFAASRGVSIINATHGGLLDVYPRKRFESLVEKSG